MPNFFKKCQNVDIFERTRVAWEFQNKFPKNPQNPQNIFQKMPKIPEFQKMPKFGYLLKNLSGLEILK